MIEDLLSEKNQTISIFSFNAAVGINFYLLYYSEASFIINFYHTR